MRAPPPGRELPLNGWFRCRLSPFCPVRDGDWRLPFRASSARTASADQVPSFGGRQVHVPRWSRCWLLSFRRDRLADPRTGSASALNSEILCRARRGAQASSACRRQWHGASPPIRTVLLARTTDATRRASPSTSSRCRPVDDHRCGTASSTPVAASSVVQISPSTTAGLPPSGRRRRTAAKRSIARASPSSRG